MFERPRGTRDFGPEEMAERRKLENLLRKTFESYGYREVMTPTFEHTELFVERSGEAILDEMYVFKDKGGRELALRPELTAPVMRFYAQDMQRHPKPLKLYYFGQVFRYERPQKGRYREFWQMGLELIGTDTPEATAEMISVAYDAMTNAGLKNFILRIGDVRILKDFLEKKGMNTRETLRAIDKKDAENLSREIREFIYANNPEKMEEYGPADEVDHYMEVLEILKSAGVEYEMDLGIARGLDYYSGVVFEIDAPALGAEKQICGGGEYRLAELFGAQPVPTSGFAIGFDRTLLALKKEGFGAEVPGSCVYIIPSEKSIALAFSFSRKLRKDGMRVEMELGRRGIGKALKKASTLGARYVVIIGEDELRKSVLSLKDMKTGEQRELSEDELISVLKTACQKGD